MRIEPTRADCDRQNFVHAAAFFDRDGTLIYDRGYINDPSQVELMPGAADLLSDLLDRGLKIIVVSNQSGIGRGFITNHQAALVHREFLAALERAGTRVDATLYCPHAPEEDCSCRKPKPGLLLEAAERYCIDLERSVMIGDKLSDCEAGERAGCRSILTGCAKSLDQTSVCLTASNLFEVRQLMMEFV
jgi:D-glycero-D-manno-heptose 1,7-bisphosphate phosphatase